MITLNIPSPRKKKAKKPPAKELWTRASHSVQNVSHWKNSESSTREFTAKASFRVLQEDHSLYSRGECFHINQEETLAKSCKCHKRWRSQGQCTNNLMIKDSKHFCENTFFNLFFLKD